MMPNIQEWVYVISTDFIQHVWLACEEHAL